MTAPDLAAALAALEAQPTITVPTLAVILGIPPATVYRAVRKGEFDPIRIGSRVVIPSAKVRALIGTAQAGAAGDA